MKPPTPTGAPPSRTGPAVLLVDSDAALHRITDPRVVAAIRRPDPAPVWQVELAAAVQAGEFAQRAEVIDIPPRQVVGWASAAAGALAPSVRDGFAVDVGALAQLCATLAGASRVQVRLAAGLGSDRCGYHVDSCRPGAAPVGVVKVYCGPPTQYPDPAAVTSVADFWTFLSRRERLVRERAANPGGAADHELAALDDGPGFLTDADPLEVPVGATVAFRLLPIEQHWQPHQQLPAWIHRSAMCAQLRLAVTVLAAPGVVSAGLRQRARAVMAAGQQRQPLGPLGDRRGDSA